MRLRRNDGTIRLVFPEKGRLHFDRGGNSQSSRYRAEAMAGSCALRDRRQSGGQNLGKPQLVGRLVLKPPKQINSADRGAGGSRKGLRQLRNSVLVLPRKPLLSRMRQKYDVAPCGLPRGATSLFCFIQARSGASRKQGFEGAPLSFFRAEAATSSRVGVEIRIRKGENRWDSFPIHAMP